ncbi:hypothetical protein HanHA300_Chr00c0069g0702441 [Helianthus annuus]|nr:hypothetical protein HanHA300_Chr00c0069g0702441 [Helianthus annuus]
MLVKVVAAALPVSFRLEKFQATDSTLPSRVEVFVQCDGYGGGAVVGRVVIMVEVAAVGWWCWRFSGMVVLAVVG